MASGGTVRQPLVSLRRNALLVRLHDRLGNLPDDHPSAAEPADAPSPASAPRVPATPATAPIHPVAVSVPVPAARREGPTGPERLVRRTGFWRQEDAERYLHFWRGDVDAMRELRLALFRITQGSAVFAMGDEQVIRGLGAQIARGALLLSENLPPPAPAMPRVLPGAGAAAAAAAAVPAAAPLAMAMEPISPPRLPLLPILEEVQIEGVEVLPEIMQSLAQVDLAMAEIDTASVSLEPTPSKIPDVQAALAHASASVTATIDAL